MGFDTQLGKIKFTPPELVLKTETSHSTHTALKSQENCEKTWGNVSDSFY